MIKGTFRVNAEFVELSQISADGTGLEICEELARLFIALMSCLDIPKNIKPIILKTAIETLKDNLGGNKCQ